MADTEFTVGRYLLRQPIGRGGMASVHLARMRGPLGFTRTVAVKRLHKHFSEEPSFASMLVDEARLASRIRHPNVVPTLDVIAEDGELLLVMEYIHAEALSALLTASVAQKQPVPISVGAAIVSAMLQGLHAAHEAIDEEGELLHLVHRDVSPQNVLVDADGQTRIADFGVAKARGRMTFTQPGEVRGKLGYMAPEQLEGLPVDRRIDIHAAGVVLWEVLTGKRLFGGASDGEVMRKLFVHDIAAPSSLRPEVSADLDAIVLRALHKDKEARFPTANEMSEAIENAVPLATQREVARWVGSLAKERLAKLAALVASIERLPPTLGAGATREMDADELITVPVLEPTRVDGPRPPPPLDDGPTETDVTETLADVMPAVERRGKSWLAVALVAVIAGSVAAFAAVSSSGTEPPLVASRGIAKHGASPIFSSALEVTPVVIGEVAPSATAAPSVRPWVKPVTRPTTPTPFPSSCPHGYCRN